MDNNPIPAKTYTPNAGAIQGNIDTLTKQISSGFNGMPAAQQQMGQDISQADNATPQLAQQRGDLIQKLFEADQAMNAKYNPQPSDVGGTNVGIIDPTAMEASKQKNLSTLWGSLGALDTSISARKQLLGDAVTRGMEVYKAGLDAKKFELDNLYKQLDLADRAEARRTGSSGGLSSENQKTLSAVEQANAAVNQIDLASRGLSMGPIAGGVRLLSNKNPLTQDSQIAAYDALIAQNAPVLVRMLHPEIAMGSGGASQAIINDVKNSLPKVTDTPQTRAMKLAQLRQTIAANASVLNSVSGVTPSFSSASGNVEYNPASKFSPDNLTGPTNSANAGGFASADLSGGGGAPSGPVIMEEQ